MVAKPQMRSQLRVFGHFANLAGGVVQKAAGGDAAPGDTVNNGALDNASGVSVMLETARLFTGREAPRQQPMQQQPAMQQPQRAMEPMAARWLDDHKDWHQNNPQRLYAVGVEAQKLLRAGYPPGDPEHYRRLNRVLAAQHDDFRPVTRQGVGQERGNGSSVVAPATRGPAGSGAKQSIPVTAEEAAYLKRNGLLPTTNKAGFLEWKANRDKIAKSGALDQRGKIAIEIAA